MRKHRKLALSYETLEDGVRFEDGVFYTHGESYLLARNPVSSKDMKAIHLVKKVFDGVIEKVDRAAIRAGELTALGFQYSTPSSRPRLLQDKIDARMSRLRGREPRQTNLFGE